MLKTFGELLWKYLLVLPSGLGGLLAIIAGCEKTGFDKKYPENHQKLLNFYNDLLTLSIDHWPYYVIICVLAAFSWALIVAEPKKVSKRKFHHQARKIRR